MLEQQSWVTQRPHEPHSLRVYSLAPYGKPLPALSFAVLSEASGAASSEMPTRLLGILGLYSRPTDSQSSDPRWFFLKLKFEKHWFRSPAHVILWVCPPHGAGSQQGQGDDVSPWSPSPASRPHSGHLECRSSPWGPSPSSTGSQDTAVHGVGGGWPELGLEGWVSSWAAKSL